MLAEVQLEAKNRVSEMEVYRGISGIYYIIENKSNRVYIGSSVDMRRRTNQHYTDLNSNTHKNRYLQNTWNKNGEDDFYFGCVEVVEDKNRLLKREQHWMDFFAVCESNKGFNLAPIASSNLGYKKTDEQIRNSILAIRGNKNAILTEDEASKVKVLLNENTPLTEIAKIMDVEFETIRSIRRGYSYKYVDPQINHDESRKAKLTEADVIIIKQRINQGVSVKDLSLEYSVSHRTISAIKNEVNWKNVGEKITIAKRKSRIE